MTYDALMFDTMFGLPAHPLLVHAPVVLLPIMGIVSVALAVRPTWRRTLGWWPLAALFVIFLMLFGALQSGEALLEAYDRLSGPGSVAVKEHEELANMTMIITTIWLVVMAGLTVIERVPKVRTAIDKPIVRQAGAVLSAVLGVVATIWLIRTGHEGAKSVWGIRVDLLFPPE